jgi:excisionase family DNA binding protein
MPADKERELTANTNISRKAYTVREVAAILGISRESVFGLLRTGQLRSILIGKRGRRVTNVQLDAYLRSLEGRPPDGP